MASVEDDVDNVRDEGCERLAVRRDAIQVRRPESNGEVVENHVGKGKRMKSATLDPCPRTRREFFTIREGRGGGRGHSLLLVFKPSASTEMVAEGLLNLEKVVRTLSAHPDLVIAIYMYHPNPRARLHEYFRARGVATLSICDKSWGDGSYVKHPHEIAQVRGVLFRCQHCSRQTYFHMTDFASPYRMPGDSRELMCERCRATMDWYSSDEDDEDAVHVCKNNTIMAGMHLSVHKDHSAVPSERASSSSSGETPEIEIYKDWSTPCFKYVRAPAVRYFRCPPSRLKKTTWEALVLRSFTDDRRHSAAAPTRPYPTLLRNIPIKPSSGLPMLDCHSAFAVVRRGIEAKPNRLHSSNGTLALPSRPLTLIAQFLLESN